MSKYDWSNVPKEVNWIATDKDGVVNGFNKKPVPVSGENMWFENRDCTGDFIRIEILNRSGIRWKDSLEERPNK